MDDAGLADFEHELITVDDDWQKNTGDAVAAQLRDAGINVKRTILPGSTFWNDWAKYPFSSTNWNHRPLEVQVLALAYRSGEAWNEFAYANPEFDALINQALSIADADARREVMGKIETLHARRWRDHPALLALALQSPQRQSGRRGNASEPSRSISTRSASLPDPKPTDRPRPRVRPSC